MREFLDRAQAATGEGGRLPLGAMPGWEVFPWEAEGLRARPLTDYAVPEPDRSADPGSCKTCQVLADPDRVLGTIGDFVVIWVPTSLVFTANVATREHLRLEDLDPASYAGMGQALGAAYSAVRALDGVGNVHVNKWENGKGHCSFVLNARPEGVLQLRGSNLPAWADMLPPTRLEELRERAEQVRAALAG
ncbi:hypothetical protein DDE18_05795 [Nocardioides gansuensis]|uniref:HIT domain-containing protein n=1 Tax=Nocardioides gansuensis TaxID=2138300 RepID=A0A2T8FDM6_9ACTN|nr:hypothetical protein [Nocardioides gansuensis]PVG83818.1 hypothetical protein DDE18_05795 [Nocardioides gansuensis]